MGYSDRIWEVIREQGWEHPGKELAARTGITEAGVSKILSGTTKNPQNVHMKKIARTLGVHTDWLIDGEPPKWRGKEAGLPPEDEEWLAIGRRLDPSQRQAARDLLGGSGKQGTGNGS